MPNDLDIFAGFENLGLEVSEEEIPEKTEKKPTKDIPVFRGLKEPSPVDNAAKRNLNLVKGRDPKAEAKALKDSAQTGAPIALTREQPDFNKIDIFKNFENTTPAVRRYLGANTVNAGISQNDINQLSTIDRLIQEPITFTGTTKSIGLGTAAGVLDLPKGVAEAFELSSDIFTQDLEAGLSSEAIEQKRAVEKVYRERTFSLGDTIRRAQDFLLSKIGPTKLEQLVSQSARTIGTMATLFLTGGETAVLPGISAISGLGKAAEARREGFSIDKSLQAGFVSFATEYLTEIIPLNILRAPATSFFKKLAAGLLADIPGELLATAIEMRAIDEGILGKEPKSIEEYMQALIDTAIVAAMTTTGITAPTHALQTATNKVDEIVEKSVNEQIKREEIAAEVDKSETKEISPEQMGLAISEMDGEAEVYIDDADRFFQSAPEKFDSIIRAVGLNPTKVKEQAAIGQDIPIKQSMLMSMLSTEDRALLMPFIKTDLADFSPDNISEAISEENKALLQETFNEVNVTVNERNERVLEQISRIKEEQRKAGLSEEEVQTNPILFEGIARKLELEGQDPVAFLSKIKLKRERFATFKKLIRKGKEIFQEKDEGIKRGALSITNERLQITLFENADLSTVLHETGHIALQEYLALEEAGEASEDLLGDIGVLRDFVGAKEGQEFTRDQSEQVARAFEAWLMEGKTPNKELVPFFERFKKWLESVYQSVRQLNVELSDDVRQVFDRMINVDSGINVAAAFSGMMAPTTNRMNELGIPTDEQSDLKRLIKKGIDKATLSLLLDRNRAIRKAKPRFIEEAEAEAREADTRGVYDTVENMREEKIRMNRQEFIERYGRDAIENLPAKRLLRNEIKPKEQEQRVRKEIVETIKREIIEAEARTKAFISDPVTKQITETTVEGGWPEYASNKGLDSDFLFGKKRKDGTRAAGAINNFLNDKKLTEQQQSALDDLVESYLDQINREAARLPEDIDFPFGELAIEEAIPGVKVLSLDAAAVRYGFESVDDMMTAFFDTPPLKEAIDFRVGVKTELLSGTFKPQDYLAINKEYTQYIVRMGEHLRKAEERTRKAGERGVSRKRITAEQMKVAAAEQMSRLTVKEAQQTNRFMSAMKKAAIQMRKAEKRNDFARAITENDKLFINKEMAAISVQNKKSVQSFIKRANKYRRPEKPKSVSTRFRKGIQSLIQRFSIIPGVAPQTDVTSKDLEKRFKGDEFTGQYIAPEFITTDKNVESPRDYRKLRMSEYRDLDNAIKFLQRQGQIEQKATLSDGVTLLAEEANESIAEMDAQKTTIKLRDRYSPIRKLSDQTRKQFARMLNLSYITKALGGYKSLREGVKSSLEKQVIERAKDLRDNQLTRLRKERELIKPHRDILMDAQRRIIKEHGRKLFVEDNGVPVPELLQNNGEQLNYWTPEQIVAMAFNRGNDSNTDALINGLPGLNIAQVDSLLERYLTLNDMDAVQNILNIINKLAPETNAVHVRVKGYDMERVQARSWTFKGKTYKGGYYPLAIDRNLASVANDFFATKKEEGDFFENEDKTFAVPYAKDTHTLARKDGHKYPVLLRLEVLDRHVDKSVRYITMAEGIRDIDRIVTFSEKIRDDEGNIIGTRSFKKSAVRIMGKDVYEQIRPALRHFVNPIIKGVDIPGNGLIRWLRSVAIPAHIALNTVTGIKQLASIVSGIGEMGLGEGGGVKAYIKGALYVVSGPQAAYNTMLDKSAFMKERLKSWERDLLKSRFDKMTPAQRELSFGDRHITWKQVIDFGYITVRVPDTIAVTPIWWGSYLDKLNEHGTNEKEAVRYADNIIEDTQPIAQPLDLSAWFREGGFWSLFNLHQTFTVGNYGQRQRTWFRAFKNREVSLMQYARFNFMDAIIPIAILTIVTNFIRGGDIFDEEEKKEMLGEFLFNWAFMGVPMARSTYIALTEGWSSPLEVAGAREAERWVDTIRLLFKGFDDMTDKQQDRAIIGLADMVADITKVPFTRVFKQVTRAEDLQELLFKPKPEDK